MAQRILILQVRAVYGQIFSIPHEVGAVRERQGEELTHAGIQYFELIGFYHRISLLVSDCSLD